MKLHLGCGTQIFEDYINVDFKRLDGIDVQADIRWLPFKSNSFELIETYHAIEHIPRQQIESALEDWFRVLKPNGELIIELPDFNQNCRDYLKAIEKKDWDSANIHLMFIYGGDMANPEDGHRWGYVFQGLGFLLDKAGFTQIAQTPARDFHTKMAACIRIKCKK